MFARTRTEIVADILQAANEGNGATKTKIMYKTFVSMSRLKEYLPLLVKTGLLEYRQDNNTYVTSPKGVKLLDICNQTSMLFKQSSNNHATGRA